MEDIDRVVAVLRHRAAETDRSGAFPVDNVEALGAAGLMGLLVSKAHGGRGESLATFVDVAGQLAGGCLSAALIWAMHCQQVDVLERHAGAELADRVLPEVAAGRRYLASVTTERGKGGRLLTAQDAVTAEDGALSFVRDAPVVTGGRHAGGFLITLRAGQDAGQHQVSLVYADRADLEVTETGDWQALGMRGTESIGLRLSGRVPAANLVGIPGRFDEIAMDSMSVLAHLGWSACWLGAARGAFSGLLGWLRDPGRRGGPDVRSDLTRERLARIRLDLELVHAYLLRSVDEVETARTTRCPLSDPATQIHLNTLKIAASELTFAAADRMVQLAGLSVGYLGTAPVPLERTFRDLRSAALNYANDRLWTVNGGLTLLDRRVSLL